MDEVTIPAGMKPWAGGLNAPADFASPGGKVQLRSGYIVNGAYRWTHYGDEYPDGTAETDVVAYTPMTPEPAQPAESPEAVFFVSLALSKPVPNGTAHSMSQSWRKGGTEQEAIDDAILFAAKEKPGFGVWEQLVARVDLTPPVTVAATDQAGEVERRVRAFIKAHDASALAPDDAGLEAAEIEAIGDLRAALATQPATGRTMGGEDGLREALENIETMLTPAGNVWLGTEPKWQTDAYARARAALQNGGE